MSPFHVAALLPLPHTVDLAAVLRPVVGTPALVRAVAGLLGPGRLSPSQVVVCCEAAFRDGVRGCLDGYGLHDVVVIPDPAGERSSCLGAGLKHLEGKEVSHVLVHDHRHALTHVVVTDRVLAALRDGAEAAMPVYAMTDSVKSVDVHDVVMAALDRSQLRALQYPRGFALSALRRRPDPAAMLDADGWFFGGRQPVTTVAGDASGERFELPEDAALLEAVIETTG